MLNLSFLGGTGEVTGANYLLEYGADPPVGGKKSLKILVDCGLFQGSRLCESKNREAFPYKPVDIDALIVTHGHLDHIGRVPKLVREGFRGKIYSTFPTRDFSELMLTDSLDVLAREAKREGKGPFYSEKDIEDSMALWQPVLYNKEFEIAGLTAIFRDAGHILGSAMVELKVGEKKIIFTGDLGNPPMPLLCEPYKFTETDYLIIESTYGDKKHEDCSERKLKLERVIEDAIAHKGVLMIPAFSIERTQELLFEMNDLTEHGRIPAVPVFLDSPLAIQATGIYKKYEDYYNKEAKYIIGSGDDVFKFPGLRFTLKSKESIAIKDVPPPKIIVAGSGMSTGGRIVHHERLYLPDAKNTLLLICYQTAGSLGRLLQDGADMVDIYGETVPVRAKIETIQGYSSHPDFDGLFSFVEKISDIKKAFVVQGEPRASSFFTQRLRDYLGVDACVPKAGDVFSL